MCRSPERKTTPSICRSWRASSNVDCSCGNRASVSYRVAGVVFLSGDRHITELLRRHPEDFYPIYEFTNSPLTAGAGSGSPNPNRVHGTLVEQRNFGTLTVSGPREDRVLTLRTLGVDGDLLWKRTIRAETLTVPDGSDEGDE